MAKIKLLLGAGVPYAATTPLWYTLALDNKYCHTGHRKEPQWLDIIQKQEEQKYISPEKYEKGYRFTDRSRRFPDTPSVYYRSRHKKPWWIMRTAFSREEEDYFFTLPTSIDKYIEYYKQHWEWIKGEYQSVADFSNSTCRLKKQFMLDIREKLLEVFDVKVIMIFRDPIQRLWSMAKCDYKNLKSFEKTWTYHRGSVTPTGWSNYSKMYTNHSEVWGKENVLPLIMEKVWKDPSELSDFLGYKIEKMHENCYYPERGTKCPKPQFLQDQWAGEHHDIDYPKLRKEFDYLYTDFEKTFGYIPEEWLP